MKKWKSPFSKVELKTLEGRIQANAGLMAYTDSCGLFLCQGGEARANVNGKDITIQAGDLYIYLPSTYVYVLEMSPDLQGITYMSTIDYILPLLGKISFSKNILSIREKPKITLTEKQREGIEQFLRLIEQRQEALKAQSESDPATILLRESLEKLGEATIHELLFCFLKNQELTAAPTDTKDTIYQNFLLSLMSRYKQTREVKAYADEQCLTPRYFSSVIKEKTGKSAQQWIIQVSINAMKQTLLYSQMTIKEIAAEYNFPTQSFFGKYFKQYVGISPKEFRNTMRHPHS